MDSLKEWALRYAALGFAVFPVKEKDKTPATAHGFKDATKDKGVISSWWDSNISHEKCNYAPTSSTILFSLDKGVVNIVGRTTKKDKDFVGEAVYTRATPKLDEAKRLIMDLLESADTGEVEISKIYQEGAALDISRRTMERTLSFLVAEKVIERKHTGYGRNKKWTVSLYNVDI